MKKLSLLLFLLPIIGLAQDTTEIDKVKPTAIRGVTIKEFKIETDRISNTPKEEGKSVIVLDKEFIKNTPAISINELLVNVAGVDIRQRGANGVQADVGIRGSTFDQVLILLNGVRMSDPQTGHHSLNIPVDISAIERIEVIKGAGARVYGQNALAGVINIVTKVPSSTFLKAKVVAGDFNLNDVTVSGGLRTKNTSHFLSLNRNTSDGYRFNTDYEITNAFYSGSLLSKNKFMKYGSNTKPRLEWMAAFTEKKFGANGFYSSPTAIDQYEETQTSAVSLKYNGKISRNTDFSVMGYWRRNQDEYLFLRQNPSFFRNFHINNIAGVNFNLLNKNVLGETGFGIDVSQVWIQSNNLGNRMRQQQTLFLEHKFSLLKNRLKITPGVQASYFSDFDGVILPGIDANYTLNKTFNVFANAGYTYRVPTYTDLFYQGRTNIGNASLNPEIALSYEAGIKAIRDGLTAQVSFFVREGTNVIDWTKPNETSPWQPNNLVKLNTKGVDLDVNWRVSQTKWIQSVRGGFTYLDQTSTVQEGLLSNYALQNLNYQANAGITFSYFDFITHTINYRYSDRVNLDDYSIVDTKLSFNWESVQIFTEISNILNQEYRETNLVVMPGRWFRIGVEFTLNKPKLKRVTH